MTRHFLDLDAVDSATLRRIVDNALTLKRDPSAAGSLLDGKVLAMLFENPSTRTRISFDVGMRQLGGSTIVLSAGDMQLGRGATIADTARGMSRYVDAIMIRTPEPAKLTELADNATIPIINGLTRHSHPCQVMADIVTVIEWHGEIAGATITWVGAANNVLTSWLHAAPAFDFTLRIATPPEFAPQEALVHEARSRGGRIEIAETAADAADGADCIVTDTWVSMGDSDADRRRELLKPFQVTEELMARVASGGFFMHCLPAHRGEEVVDAVLDGDRSAAWDEAENRLHAQKGILLWCLEEDL